MDRSTVTDNCSVVDDYLQWLEHRARRSPRTVRTYAYALRSYVEWLGDLPLSSVTFSEVEDFGNRDRRVQEASTATVRKDVVIVRNFHQWAVERDYPLRLVSTAIAPAAPRPAPKPVEDDVWLTLWLSELSDHDRLWLGLGYFCGLRRIEIVTVKPSEVDTVNGTMRFVRKGGSPQSIEYVEMYGAIRDELPHLCGDFDWLALLNREATTRAALGANYLWFDSIGDPVNDGNRLNKRLDNKLLPQLGLPPGSVTPHRLRHSCATNLLRAGVDPTIIMNALSHSDMSITRRYMQTSGQLARWRMRERRDGG